MPSFEENISNNDELTDFAKQIKNQGVFTSQNFELIQDHLKIILDLESDIEYFEQVVESYSSGNAGDEALKEVFLQNADHISSAMDAAVALEKLQKKLADALAGDLDNVSTQNKLKAIKSINNYVIDNLLLDLMSELHQYEVVKDKYGSTPLTLVVEQREQKAEEFIDVLAERNPDEAKYIYNMILEEEK